MTPTNTRKDSSPSWSRLRNQQQQKRKNWKRPKEGARVFLFSLLPLSCSLTFGSVLLLTPSPPRFFSLSLLSLFSLSSLSLFFHLLKVWQLAPNAFGFLLVSSFFFEREGRAREKREREERERREKREDRHCARAWLWRERRKRRERERREREKRERREAFNLDLSPTWRTWT